MLRKYGYRVLDILEMIQVTVNWSAKVGVSANGFQIAMRPIRTPPNTVGAPAIFCCNTGHSSIFLFCLDSRGFRSKTEQVPPGRPKPLSTRCCGHHTRRSLICAPSQKTLMLVTRTVSVILDPAVINTKRRDLPSPLTEVRMGYYLALVTLRHPPSFPQ
jgi:hypothetical protein